MHVRLGVDGRGWHGRGCTTLLVIHTLILDMRAMRIASKVLHPRPQMQLILYTRTMQIANKVLHLRVRMQYFARDSHSSRI